ncbi:MAG: DUF4293 domain-containing protein [Bacteroidales bacterium]|nr:DUF4293 domain-containing protein [Bacteroidales bacterium]
MIQRIQTLFLFLALISGALVFFFPLADFYSNFQEAHGNFKLYASELKSMDPDPRLITSIWFTSPLWICAGVSVLLTLVTIFLYKNRMTQLRLVAFTILLNITFVVLVFLIYANKITKLTQIEPSYQVGIFFPLITLVFLILANRSIRKDEALVKSTDRLR